MARRGVYPGTFNPLTVAHLAVAEAAWRQCALDVVVLAVSRSALAKEDLTLPLLEHRVAVLEHAAAGRPWLEVAVTDLQLIAEISAGYDVVVMGADKWEQVQDPRFYAGDPAARDRALRALPAVAIAPRPPHPVPADVVILELPSEMQAVSASAVRDGQAHLMSDEAAELDRRTGAWTDPDRYRQLFAAKINQP